MTGRLLFAAALPAELTVRITYSGRPFSVIREGEKIYQAPRPNSCQSA